MQKFGTSTKAKCEGEAMSRARLNQALIRPVHRGPTVNDIFPKPTHAKYLTLIDTISEYHNLKLDEKLSYLMTFCHQFGRYRYMRLPFGPAPSGDIFQRKIDKIIRELPNVFDIADDILIVDFNNNKADHDRTANRVLQIG